MKFIGIDPGVNVGLAVWCTKSKTFDKLVTVDFWECIGFLQRNAVADQNGEDTQLPWEIEQWKVVLENPSFNRPTFDHGVQNRKIRENISQKVGSNKRDAQLIYQFCKLNKIACELVAPNTRGKLNAIAFKNITRHEGDTSQHARDAGMLVFQRNK